MTHKGTIQVDFRTTIKDWYGDPVPRKVINACPECGIEQEIEELTLRHVCLDALAGVYADEKNLESLKKYLRMDLGMKIVRKDVVEMTPDEITMLKKLTSKAWQSPLILTQTHRALDPSLEGEEG